jgi:hypothetical protein
LILMTQLFQSLLSKTSSLLSKTSSDAWSKSDDRCKSTDQYKYSDLYVRICVFGFLSRFRLDLL